MCCKCKNPILFFFALLMCSEWGDRSQISAIALAPNYGLWSIVIGGSLAHVSCILCAMILGKVVQKICTVTIINLLGGILFIMFGLYDLFFKLLYPEALDWE
jgi:Ca2+/H+ antiporter, TMEM165/GDT1 family